MNDQTLGPESIKEIERLTKAAGPNETKVVTLDGRNYSTQPLHDLRKPETAPEGVKFSSLQGLADFALADCDKSYTEGRGGRFLLVDGPTQVRLLTGLFGDFNQRTCLGWSVPFVPDFKFGVDYPADSFVPALLSQFAPTPDRAAVFALTGTVESGSAIKTADDGVSQLVTTRRGIERSLESVGPQRMFALRPYSTFAEIDVPERPFILRMKPGDAQSTPPRPHSCALLEADGGLWRVGAVAEIKRFLKSAVGDKVPVYG